SADVIAINKADMEGADRLKTDLESMLAMKSKGSNDWMPPLVLTEAVNGKGGDELVSALLNHRDYLKAAGALPQRRKERARLELLGTIEGYLKDLVYNFDSGGLLEKLVADLQQGKTTPHRAAREILARLKIMPKEKK
ncbi:MAG: P-loop NTPase family protein, partial [Dehalococcoidales bacterium]